MPSYCVVPNCPSNRRKSGKRLSTFKVPSNGPLREKWLLAIPGLQNFRSWDRVCEQHFDKSLIIKEFVKYDNSGKEIARVPYTKSLLKNGAVPTIFEVSTSDTTSNNIFYTDHTYAAPFSLQPTTVKSAVQNESTNLSSANTLDVANKSELLNENPQKIKILHDVVLPRNKCVNIETLDQGINLGNSTIPVNMNSDMKKLENSFITASQYEPSCDNNDFVQNNVERIPLQEKNFSPESAATYNSSTESTLSCEPSDEILDEPKLHSTDNQPKTATSDMQCTEELIIFDSITFSFENLNNEQKRSNGHIKLPSPWNANKLIKGTEETLLLTCILSLSGNEKYVLEKAVIIKRSRDIVYEIYSTCVDVTDAKLPQVLEDPSKLPEILKKFKDIRICKGITATNLTNINENKCLKQDIYCNIRHVNCSIISINSARCLWCKKYSKVLLQKIRRIKATKDFERVDITGKSLERIKLKTLRNKLKAKARKVKITRK